MDHTVCPIMKKLIPSLLGAGCLAAVAVAIISNAKRHAAVTVVGIYWHFVDVIWLFLVSVLYLRLL